MATRFYFPATGTAPASPAFASSWEGVNAAPNGPLRLPLPTTPGNTTLGTQDAHIPPAVTAPVDTAHRQWVSTATLPAGAISGTFSLVIGACAAGGTQDSFLQAVIRVVSGDGATVRGTLYAGNTLTAASASTSSLAYEFSTGSNGPLTAYRTRLLSGTLTSVTAVAGDRIVVEVGSRTMAPNGSSRTASLAIQDLTSLSDFTATVDQVGNAGRPWIEFSQDLFPTPPAIPTSVAATSSHASVTLTWAAPASGPAPTSYEVELGLVPSGGTGLVDVGLATSHTFTGLFSDSTYYPEVRSVGVAGSSAWVRVTLNTKGPPRNLAVTPAATSIALTWDPPASGSAGITYEVRRDAGTPAAATSPHTFTGLTAGTLYFLEVRAVLAGVDNSPWVGIEATTVGAFVKDISTGATVKAWGGSSWVPIRVL